MDRFWLRVQAPFAAFQYFQAGTYFPSAPIMPPTVAYGLVLNLAGIENRPLTVASPVGICTDTPALRIAVGLLSKPTKCTLVQWSHSYRISLDKRALELAQKTKGAKYWINMVKREVLVGYDGVIGVESNDTDLQERIRQGLKGELPTPRYGLPFAGRSDYLFDRIEFVTMPPAETIWYMPARETDSPKAGSCRLTIHIDREDSSKTVNRLYVPGIPAAVTYEQSWVWIHQPSS